MRLHCSAKRHVDTGDSSRVMMMMMIMAPYADDGTFIMIIMMIIVMIKMAFVGHDVVCGPRSLFAPQASLFDVLFAVAPQAMTHLLRVQLGRPRDEDGP